MTREASALEKARLKYDPKLPEILRRGIRATAVEEGKPTAALRDPDGFISGLPVPAVMCRGRWRFGAGVNTETLP